MNNMGIVICTDEFVQTKMAVDMLTSIMDVVSVETRPIYESVNLHMYIGASDKFTEPNGVWECTFSYNIDTKELTPILRKYGETKN